MRLMENRRIAFAVCALCVLAAVVGLGGMKLRARETALERTFIYGTETRLATRHSMDEYLDRCAKSASALAQEAKRHLSDSELIDPVLLFAGELSKTDGMDGRRETYDALTLAVEDLYSALQAAGAAGEVNVSAAYHDYTGAQNLIKNDGYHAEASAYNAARGAFPANLIATVWGLHKAETYGW